MSDRAASLEPVEVVELSGFVRRLAAGNEVSAVVAGVAQGSRMATAAAGGLIPGDDRAAPVTLSCSFDLASLTKPFIATAALLLDRRGALSLNLPLGEYVPGLPPAVRRIALEFVWRHAAGLIPWFPFYSEAASATLERFADASLWRQATAGQAQSGIDSAWPPPAYSDLGPILWSLLARREGGDPQGLLRECGLAVSYAPDPATTAATALSNRREVELAAALGIVVEEEQAVRQGVAQDGNARVIPQPGHAGLFAGLEQVVALGREWLRPRVLDDDEVAAALRGTGRHAFGWWRAEPARDALPATAFGHNGFTGCSLWMEPEGQRIMALLAHRTTLSDTLERARREFHRLALSLRI